MCGGGGVGGGHERIEGEELDTTVPRVLWFEK